MTRSSLRKRNHWSVQSRLVAWNVCFVVLLLAALGGIVRYATETTLRASVERELERQCARFQEQAHRMLLRDAPEGHFESSRGFRRGDLLNARWPENPPPPRYRMRVGIRRDPSYIPRILNTAGTPMPPYQTLGPWDPQAFRLALRNQEVRSSITVDDEQVRVLSEPVVRRGRVIGVIQAVHAVGEMNRAIADVKETLLALIPAGLLFAGFGGAVVTRRALRPVRQIADTVEKIDAADMDQRLEIVGSDVFAHLAKTFNRMLGRLRIAFGQLATLLEQQKRFTADASHELKTPLAIARVHTDLLLKTNPTQAEYRESVQSIADALDRMNILVHDLLLLAQHDASSLPREQTICVVGDLVEAARRLHSLPGQASIVIDPEDMNLTVPGNEGELVRVFSNLLDNALRHTPSTGTIHICCYADGDNVRVHIVDTGEGIAAEHLPHLGERFYRIDSDRSRVRGGSGLGLSICKSLLARHGGSLAFANQAGEGMTVMITLPRYRTSMG